MEGGGRGRAEAGEPGLGRAAAVGRGSLRPPSPLPPAEQLTVVGKISFNPKDVLGRGAGGTFVFR